MLAKMASGDFTLEQRDAGTAGHLVFTFPTLGAVAASRFELLKVVTECLEV